jgi:hypothetical protein
MKARNLLASVALIGLICALISTPAAAKQNLTIDGQVRSPDQLKSVPTQLNYQGYLADASDSSAVTATLEMTFRLFDSEIKGAELWAETHTMVEVSEGLFQVLLGSVTSFPSDLFDGSTLWLQTEVGTEILAPRKPLVSVAYAQTAEMADYAATADWATDAQNAVHADTADHCPGLGAWTVSGDDVYRLTGKVGIGTTSPLTELDVSGSVNASTYYGDGSNLTGISGTTDNDWTIDGNDVYRQIGNVGIGISSPAHPLDVHGTVNTDSVYAIGGQTVLSNIGMHNTFLGVYAGNDTAGSRSTFVGYQSGSENEGMQNVFLGRMTGRSNSTGNDNTFVGDAAGFDNIDGSGNTFLGWAAGYLNTSGVDNTYLGRAAGYTSTAGDSNVFIGNLAGWDEAGSHKLYIANGPDTGDVLIYGDFATGRIGLGTLSPSYSLDVSGDVNATTYYGDGSNLTGISGTTDNDWIISAPDIYSALAGKVGIGVTHPTTKLEVDGDVKATAFHGDGSNLTGISGTADDDWTIDGDDIYHETGDVGIGTTTPDRNLHIYDDVNNLMGIKLENVNTEWSSREGITFADEHGEVAGIVTYDDDATTPNSMRIYNNRTGGALTFWTGSLERMRLTNAGQFGIGTSSPGAKLHVEGTIEVDQKIQANDSGGLELATDEGTTRLFIHDNGNVGIGLTTPNRSLYIAENVDSLAYPLKIDNYNGNWNVAAGLLFSAGGNGTPSGILDTARGKGALAYEYTGTWNRGKFHFLQNTVTDDSNPDLSDAVMTIANDGKVGIGTTNPAAQLDVRGTVNVGLDDTGYDVNFFGATSGGRLFWDEDKMALRTGLDSDGSHWMPDSVGLYSVAAGRDAAASGIGSMALGYYPTAIGTGSLALGSYSAARGDHAVAIGENSFASADNSIAIGYINYALAEHSISIGNYANAEATNAIVLGTGVDYSNRLVNSISNSLVVGFNTTTPTLFVGGASHRVGVGTSSPTRKFWVNGDAGGTGAWHNDSDERLKHDITTIENALDKVTQLRGVIFHWNDTHNHPEGAQVGLIAQEVQEVVPEVVEKKGEYYSLATANLVPVLIEAVKEQQRAIEEQALKIADLQAQLDALR